MLAIDGMRAKKITQSCLTLIVAFVCQLTSARLLAQGQESTASTPAPISHIANILRQTKTVSVSCGDDADMQTCKFFVNALGAALRKHGVQVLLFNDSETLVQSFYVPPRLLPSHYVTLRLIEDGSPVRLYLGGFCFDPERSDFYKGLPLPRWSQTEGGKDVGPLETDKAAAASKLAQQFASYWSDTVGTKREPESKTKTPK
jgi:hypothetical protein